MKPRTQVALASAAIIAAWSVAVFARQQPPAEAPIPGPDLTRQQIVDRLTTADYRSQPSIADGQVLFQGRCSTCHIFGDVGSSVGPDLSTLGSRFRKKDVLESILWPSRTISDQYAMTTLTLDDGATLSGLVSGETAQYVFLKTAEQLEGRGVPVLQTRITDRKDSTVSMMPEGLVAGLTLPQIDSLVAFLLTGK